MNTLSAQNLEDAANIASEFVYSLDNLPHEIRYLLEEMRVMESKVQDLQSQIDTDSAKFMRWNLGIPPPPKSSSEDGPTSSPPPSQTRSSSHSPPSALPSKIASNFAQISHLSDQKIALGQRIIDLVKRTRWRLDIELGKVRVLTGEQVVLDHGHLTRGVTSSSASLSAAGTTGGSLSGIGGGGGGAPPHGSPNPAQQISDSLRTALMIGSPATTVPALLPSEERKKENGAGRYYTKPLRDTRRRPGSAALAAATAAASASASSTSASPNGGGSLNIKLPPSSSSRANSPTTSGVVPYKAPVGRPPKGGRNAVSRLSRQIALSSPDENEMDADGDSGGNDNDSSGDASGGGEGLDDEGGEVGDEDDDKTLYCFCQKPSYGEMVACDDMGCPYEWFHLACLGLKKAPDSNEPWYCPHCTDKHVVTKKRKK